MLGKDSRKPWGKWDIVLAEAYEIMQSERCKQCGWPVWICHNEDVDHFKLVDETCFAIKELKRVEKEKGKQKGYEPPAGVVYRPVPAAFGEERSYATLGVREAYYKSLAPEPT